jgi:hypothetical protein
MRVVFKNASETAYHYTPSQPCTGAPLTFLVAGMLPSTKYGIFQRVTSTSGVTNGPPGSFTTGALPASLTPYTVIQAPTSKVDTTHPILLTNVLNSGSAPNPMSPVAMDLAGNILWYYISTINPTWPVFLTRMLPNGNMLMIVGNNNATLVEIDLAWNIIHQTTTTAVNAQLAAMGLNKVALNFNHEARRLPNGHTIVFSNDQQLLTNVQGPGTLDVMGDLILDLDENFNVAWVWDGFDHLDTSRTAILGEVCNVIRSGITGELCPAGIFYKTANDWLHANSVAYDPTDGNLVVSLRHQDWVVKIDYSNGTGTGNVLWHLGPNGDFQMLNTPQITSPWFTHQHDVDFEPNAGPGIISLFDNGNTRQASDPSATSRGQVLTVNEVNMTADIVLSADMKVYSSAGGTAQLLSNGNYHFFDAYVLNPAGTSYKDWNVEVVPNGTPDASGALNFIAAQPKAGYRSFRLVDMYTEP